MENTEPALGSLQPRGSNPALQTQHLLPASKGRHPTSPVTFSPFNSLLEAKFVVKALCLKNV